MYSAHSVQYHSVEPSEKSKITQKITLQVSSQTTNELSHSRDRGAQCKQDFVTKRSCGTNKPNNYQLQYQHRKPAANKEEAMSSYKKKGGSSWNSFAGGVGSGGFGGGGGPNNNNNNNGGVGYAGGKDDQRKLVAGRKKAIKESKKEDKSTTKSLKMMNKSIQKNLAKHCGLDDEIDLSHSSYDALAGLVDTDDRGQVKTILADVFRNQVPTDWDTRKALYTAALDLTNTLV